MYKAAGRLSGGFAFYSCLSSPVSDLQGLGARSNGWEPCSQEMKTELAFLLGEDLIQEEFRPALLGVVEEFLWARLLDDASVVEEHHSIRGDFGEFIPPAGETAISPSPQLPRLAGTESHI